MRQTLGFEVLGQTPNQGFADARTVPTKGVPGVFGWVMVSSGSSACADGTIVPRPGPDTSSGGPRGRGRRVARASRVHETSSRDTIVT